MCRQPTEMSVSRSESGEASGTMTRCRRCATPFITISQPDGTVIVLDGTKPPDLGAPITALAILRPPPTKSGYRVEPPPHLGVFDRGGRRAPPDPGVSDEELATSVVATSRVLRRPDGSARPPRDAAKYVGWRTVWVAQLNEAIEARLSGPPPLSFPPGIFISYRWGSDAENAWVADLAHSLKTRGYAVTFDRDEPKDLDVPDLVSRVADARYFVAVLDPGYVERIGRGDENEATKDGWVFDEYNTAAMLSKHGQTRVLGFLRSGTTLPRGFREPRPGTPGNTLDVRTPAQLGLVIDDVFPSIESAPDEAVVERARGLLRRSHECLQTDRFPEAMDSASELAELLPGVIDGIVQKIRVALAVGWPAEGLASAEEALTLAPRSRELLLAAGIFANGASQPRRAIAHLALMLEMHSEESGDDIAQAHHALGSALDDVDEVYAGLAHLEICRSMAPKSVDVLNTLGFVYRRANEMDRAIASFDDAVALEPDNVKVLTNRAATLVEAGRSSDADEALDALAAAEPEHPGVDSLRELVARIRAGEAPPVLVERAAREADQWGHCSHCAAHIPLDSERQLVCARCGSSLAPAERTCPNCGSDGRVFPGLSAGLACLCPFCRKGSLSIA